MRRTQHGDVRGLAVPRPARTDCGRSRAASGLLGKLATDPSGTQACCDEPARRREDEADERDANSAAATALSAMPSLNRKPRRETGDSAVVERGGSAIMLSALDRVGLPGRNAAGARRARRPRRRPAAARHRRAVAIAAPVGHPEVGPADDHGRAQRLVAHQREIRADRRSSRPCGPPVARRAVAAPRSARRRPPHRARASPGPARVGRQRRRAGERTGSRPARAHARDQQRRSARR